MIFEICGNVFGLFEFFTIKFLCVLFLGIFLRLTVLNECKLNI